MRTATDRPLSAGGGRSTPPPPPRGGAAARPAPARPRAPCRNCRQPLAGREPCSAAGPRIAFRQDRRIQRICPDRPVDVLERLLPEIAERQGELVQHLFVDAV